MKAERFFATAGAVSYLLDFALIPAAVAGMLLFGPVRWPAIVVGLAAWTFAEYIIHRAIFHRIPMFEPAHDRHHAHPKDWVGVPSWISASGFAAVWLAAFVLAGAAVANSFTSGLLIGYLCYFALHVRIHHGNPETFGRAIKHLALMHAVHHRGGRYNFGVTTPFWDLIFRTYRAP